MNKNNCTETKHDRSFAHGVLFGAVLGVLAGIFLIPPEGKQKREKLKEKIDPILDEVKPLRKDIGHKVMQLTELPIEDIKNRIAKDNENAAKRKFFKGTF